MSWSADTADADADEDEDIVLDSLCCSCPPTIVDEKCKVNLIVGVLILGKKLRVVQPISDTVILDQCANGLP